MYYNNYGEIKLSALGMGCMRLPTNGGYENIDIDLTAEMVEYAMEKGVNYFDTAWGYHNGRSESVMGEILSKYPRDKYYLASKFPGYDLANMGKVEEIFEEQLKKCRTDHFDFYLFHNVCEMNIDAYLDPKYGIYDYLMEQKKNGRIKHLGFSTHANTETFKRFLDAYGDDMEFCQIQLNWLDWDFQDAKSKVEILNSLSIPIWVMEPVRGGKLCSLSPKYEAMLKKHSKERSAAEWAFRYLQTIPGVTVALSGMSNIEQLKENINTYAEEKSLNAAEMQTLADISSDITSKSALPCTACRYCTEKCPIELDIPRIIELYNEHVYTEGGFIAPMAMEAIDSGKRPNACLGCRACEAVCPQNIKISEMMSDFSERLK